MPKSKDKPVTSPWRILIRFLAVAGCALLWPALVTFEVGDFPSPHQYPHNDPTANLCGPVGAWFAFHLKHYVGEAAYPLLLFATCASLIKLFGGRIENWWERIFGLSLFVVSTAAAVHLIPSIGLAVLPVGHGGVVGYAIGEYLHENLRALGTLIVLGSCLFVGLLFATDGWVLRLPAVFRRVGVASGSAITTAGGIARSAVQATASTVAVVGSGRGGGTAVAEAPARAKSPKRKASRVAVEDVEEDDEQPTLFDDSEIDEDAEADEVEDDGYEYEYVYEDEEEEDGEEDIDIDVEDDQADPESANTPKKSAKKRGKKAGLVVNYPSPKKQPVGAYPKEIENWVLPSQDLLAPPEYGFSEQQEQIVREQARILERTLDDFRLDAHVVEIDTGPVITMFELKLGAGIKVSQIASLANDIARTLKAHAIRVVAPIPGKNTVGIEVPNVEKEVVRLKELMITAGKKASGMKLPLFLGKDAAGKPLVADLTKMPHLLIAGTTGSGKSVCVNSIIVSILMTQRPDHVKLILVDPKMVEMANFKDIPHLMSPIVTDMGQAEKILEWAVGKMEERYALLAECRTKNIAEFNALGADEVYERLQPAGPEEKASISTHMPYIVIIIDELADLMMTSGKEVEHHLCRLAQKSRAVGVHIIVATQRPEAKVVTGLIKSNMPSRISFRVASRMDSRIVLDQNGGEVLMGQGDMLFLPPGTHKLMRAQGTFLDNDEVQVVLDDLSGRAKPEFHPELAKLPSAAGAGSSTVRDPLFDKAASIVIQTQRGSVSLLQRRLTIGYSRASRLVDQMAEAGIVGEYKGSQAREVLLTMEEWNAIQKQVAKDIESEYVADMEDYGDPLESDVDDEDEQEADAEDEYEEEELEEEPEDE